MGFKEENKYFIQQIFFSEMKGLSEENKLLKYETKKYETRKKLKEFYLKCDKKLPFYKDAFYELSFYETDFLMLNLFLEKDVDSLFTFLSSNSFNNLNFLNKNCISFKFWQYMNEVSNEKNINMFLKLSAIELMKVNERTWNNDSNSIKFSQFFAEWLLKSSFNTIDNNPTIFSYLLFTKLWNSEELYINDYTNQSILLYFNFNKKFDELKQNSHNVDLYKIINIFGDIAESLLNNETICFPILDTFKNSEIITPLLNQKEEFNKRIKLSEIICCSFTHKSYSYIFKLMDEFNDEIVLNKLNTELNDKLNNYVFPTHEDVEEIINKIYNIDKVNSYKKDFLRRLYIY
jgi:hypothetical protein